MVKTELLEEIGLTKSEIKVYLALLELGSVTTGKIVENSRVASSKVYEVLDKLIQKGLASYIIKSGTKYFAAASPERIIDYLMEKKNKLNQQEEQIKQLVPELELKRHLSKYRSQATIFSGIKGAETAFNDVLKSMKRGEEYYVIGATNPTPQFSRFIYNFHKKRAKLGIKVKLLFCETGRQWAENIQNLPHTKIKFAPSQLLTSSFVLMYKDKTLITVSTKTDLTLFRIDNSEVTNSFKSQFELLWNQETVTMTGLDAVQQLFESTLDFGKLDMIGARGYFLDARPKFVDDWEKRALQSGFKLRNIVDPGVRGHRITTFPFAQTRYNLPREFSDLSVFWIFGNKVAIVNWTKTEPILFIIDNKEVHDTYQKQFELLWNKEIS